MTTRPAPGTRFKVRVGGVEYDSIIDPSGRERFVENPEHRLVKMLAPPDGTGTDDMNSMRFRFINGEFSRREYAEFHMAIGYSLSGFMELSPFFCWEIDTTNPDGYGRDAWEPETPDPYTELRGQPPTAKRSD